MPTKPLFWVGTSLDDIRSFPADARRMAGYQLRLIQDGLDPTDWKPMSTIGPGACELRIHTRLAHRVFYVAKLTEGVYVLHAFEKRTRKTPKAEIELARTRLRQAMRRRSTRKD